MDILQTLDEIYFHKLDIRFYPNDVIQMPYWIGSVLRNRFLYTAEGVCNEQGTSLYTLLNTLPLSENHAYYKSLIGGFPKGFLFDCSTLPDVSGKVRLEKEHIYTFSLILIGRCADYYPLFVQTLQLMFSEGFGHPMVSLTLIDICENGDLLYSDNGGFLNPLSCPFKIDFPISYQEKEMPIMFHFKTPVNLISRVRNEKNENGYQSKLNNFPSFYQFMRSSLHRLFTLNLLYVNSEFESTPKLISESIEEFINPATRAILLHADIRYEKRYSTPRMNETNVYTMYGYCGTLSFDRISSHFIPLLSFNSYLGIGNDINYGLGIFDLKY